MKEKTSKLLSLVITLSIAIFIIISLASCDVLNDIIDKNLSSEMTLDKIEITLKIGETYQLTLNTPQNEDRNDYIYEWQTSDPNVVSVKNGLINAISIGTAIITVSDNEGNYVTCTVTVVKDELHSHTPGKEIKENEVSATCTENGSYEIVIYCTTCKEEISRNSKFTQKRHTESEPIKENEIAATCTTDGSYDSVVYCSACDQELSRTKITTNSAHNYVNKICTLCGVHYYSEGLAYAISVDKTYYVVKSIANCSDKDIVIPPTYRDLPVKEIADFAFQLSHNICSITIPNSIIRIGNGSFELCTNLTSIKIPDSVTSIGKSAFSTCYALTDVSISGDIGSIGDNAFELCYALTDISISGDIGSIGDNAFGLCDALTNVSISGDIGSIGDNAFSHCDALTDVSISGDIGSIGDNAFSHCDSLISISLNVENIDNYAFAHCDNLTDISLGNNLINIGESVFAGCESLVYTIYDNAYYLGNDKNPTLVLASVTSASITSCKVHPDTKIILLDAFSGCYNLSSETEYDNAYYIGTINNPYMILLRAKSTSITSCEIHNDAKVINSSAFSECSALESISIPSNVTCIDFRAFNNCSKLSNLILAEGLESIGAWAFDGCAKLITVTIPSTVTAFHYPFAGTGIAEIYALSDDMKECISEHLSEFGSPLNVYSPTEGKKKTLETEDGFIFYEDGDIRYLLGYKGSETNIILPNNVTSINKYAFSGCSSLTSIVIPDSVTSIGGSAFYGCSSLTSIVIPDNVTTIKDHAFQGCSNLTSVMIGKSVTSIGYYAFFGCNKITVVYYNGNADKWSNISIHWTSTGLTSATRYYYSENEPTEDGNFWRYDEDGNIVVW